MRPGLTCVMSAMQAFFGGNLSLILASLSQSEVRRDYSASVSVSVSVSTTSSLSRGRGALTGACRTPAAASYVHHLYLLALCPTGC